MDVDKNDDMDITINPWSIQENQKKKRKLSNKDDNVKNYSLFDYIEALSPQNLKRAQRKTISWTYDAQKYNKFQTGHLKLSNGLWFYLNWPYTILLDEDSLSLKTIKRIFENMGGEILFPDFEDDDENFDGDLFLTEDYVEEKTEPNSIRVIINNKTFIGDRFQSIYRKSQSYISHIYFDFENPITLDVGTCAQIENIANCFEKHDLIIRTNVCILDIVVLPNFSNANVILQSPYRNEGMDVFNEFYKSFKAFPQSIMEKVRGWYFWESDISDPSNTFEGFIRYKTNNNKDSIDKIMYDLGGKYLWGDMEAINKTNFGLFFPGMYTDIDMNYESYMKFRKTTLKKSFCLTTTFIYFGVKFDVCIQRKSDGEPIEILLYLKNLIETENNENTELIVLHYSQCVLELKYFFHHSDKGLIQKYMKKIIQNETRKGALQKRGFLYVRLITNLLRSTGRIVSKIQLEDVWRPVKGKFPESSYEWYEYTTPRDWQGDYMGNGPSVDARYLQEHGFYGNFMKELDKNGGILRAFEPWISNTAIKF
jgi:hypothetical protein